MFVLPPPPRYPQTTTYPPNSPYAAQTPMPILETNNLLTHPTGPDCMFFAGEGQYTLREDILLATPPPHPSEAPVLNPNPLATNQHPPTAGTKLSLLTILNKTPAHPGGFRGLSLGQNGTSTTDSHEERTSEPRTSTSTEQSSDNASKQDSNDPSSPNALSPIDKFGGGNSSLTATGGKDTKRKKPKNNIAKSNSSFVSRIITHENLLKRLSERATDDLFCFANINRAFNWLDLSAQTNKYHALCHDANELTKSSSHIDVIIGFSSGDVIWFDPISNKYSRLNKNGTICNSPALDIQWLPGSENLFLVAHGDGSLIVYDKEKEDAVFISERETMGDVAENLDLLITHKSVNSPNQKTNPVSFWNISKHALNAFAFSPDGKHLAVVSEDGKLHVVNIMKERLLDVYNSYYGGFLCVCWSPDGRYVVTGGQDDLVSIWSFSERRLVARCTGHHSWVTSVAFDPWRCDSRTYRFGSVGEDCRLLLWDFSVSMLTRPKAQTTGQHRASISSALPSPAIASRARAESNAAGRLRSESISVNYNSANGDEPILHDVETRARTSNLPPIMSKAVDIHPLTSLQFREDSIITTCAEGHIRTWDRPHITQAKSTENSIESGILPTASEN